MNATKLAVALGCTCLAPLSSAATPVLTHQGRLLDAVGAAVDGSQTLTFKIYANALDASAVWSEQDTVAASQGYYATTLGDGTPFPAGLFTDETLWLGITVGTGPELTPRQRLTGVPYAAAGGGFTPPSAPAVMMGHNTDVCSSSGYGWIDFPADFPTKPIFTATIDEGLNNSGAVWERMTDWHRNRVGVRCDAQSEGTSWFAIEPGVHTISGKTVMAGHTGAITNGAFVTFPQAFTVPPIVLLFIDESGDDNGAISVRTINTITASQFQIYANQPMDGLFWIAMEAGRYTHGPYTWEAGERGPLNNGSAFTFTQPFTMQPGVVATIYDTNNSGASYVRTIGTTESGFSTYVNAGSEKVHYVAFEETR